MKDLWRPSIRIIDCIKAVKDALLAYVIKEENTCALNQEAMKLKRQNWERYCTSAALWVQKYAIKKKIGNSDLS